MKYCNPNTDGESITFKPNQKHLQTMCQVLVTIQNDSFQRCPSPTVKNHSSSRFQHGSVADLVLMTVSSRADPCLTDRCWSSKESLLWCLCCAAPTPWWARRLLLLYATFPLKATATRRPFIAAVASQRWWRCSNTTTLWRSRNSWQVQICWDSPRTSGSSGSAFRLESQWRKYICTKAVSLKISLILNILYVCGLCGTVMHQKPPKAINK